tara:strand:+ start:418 stop:576 length:159 start_codon:yes stop_codon:yes gene_type:complete
MEKDKRKNLVARGIRFSEEVWSKVSKDAEDKNSTPSDFVRGILDKHYGELEK